MTAGTQTSEAMLKTSSPSPIEGDQAKPLPSPRRKKRPRIYRLVSSDDMNSPCDSDPICREKDPSSSKINNQFPTATAEGTNDSHTNSDRQRGDSRFTKCPSLPNPLDAGTMMALHMTALRLEADLHPMRLILSRLMSNTTLNRKGLFNVPVNAAKLNLVDYDTVIKQPMDLGTVKRNLHAITYKCRAHVARDIRLTFRNAMKYNPPQNHVHINAKGLLASFEDSYAALGPSLCSTNHDEECAANVPIQQEDIATSATTDKSVSMEVDMPDAAPLQKPASVEESKDAMKSAPASCRNYQPRASSRIHDCEECEGDTCQICMQGCILHEPSLLICQGSACAGARVRKGAPYYVSSDGSQQYCQRCYSNLPPILPRNPSDPITYKQTLLKRKNEEEVAEKWVRCGDCVQRVHQICAMFNPEVHSASSFKCPACRSIQPKDIRQSDSTTEGIFQSEECKDDSYTFESGHDMPIPLKTLHRDQVQSALSAETLPRCAIASFIEEKVRSKMTSVPDAAASISVRIISDCERSFPVPDVIRRHFRMQTADDTTLTPPVKVKYNQKAIALFQKIDGLDVCVFCMYVQEYDGNDEYDQDVICIDVQPPHAKRVYIAYLDSVEHFRPRSCRTAVYHEILVAYLATARERGFNSAQIWACPPSRGNSFVFWNHPSSQRTPNMDHLTSWYHSVLSHAVQCGVVTNVQSLFESDFEQSKQEIQRTADAGGSRHFKPLCPPLIDGDYWLEETVRVHSAALSRYSKTRLANEVCVWNVSSPDFENLDPCPAMQVGALVRDRIMTHPSSVVFHRPVNAAALKLKDYHKIVKKPMDLSTLYSKCIIGEYDTLQDFVDDFELMVSNAKRFNPAGHFVHMKAIEISGIFFQELNQLCKHWKASHNCDSSLPWKSRATMSMNLDHIIEPIHPTEKGENAPTVTMSVLIEDDRSSDGSKSLCSASVDTSILSSPIAAHPSVGESAEPKCDHVTTTLPGNAVLHARKKMHPSHSIGQDQVTTKKVVNMMNLLTGGPEAIRQHMCGEDTWLLEKNPVPPKPATSQKKKGSKKRKTSVEQPVESNKRRKQSWLGEEVSDSVRRMRTSFFTCSLSPKRDMAEAEVEKFTAYKAYIKSFSLATSREEAAQKLQHPRSCVADARHALLEFSQFRHFEFDTLRRAKYSTAMLLYHLHHENAPGMVPICTTCDSTIQKVRWHRVKKHTEKRRVPRPARPPQSNTATVSPTTTTTTRESVWKQEELCGGCRTDHPHEDQFIPIPISIKPKL